MDQIQTQTQNSAIPPTAPQVAAQAPVETSITPEKPKRSWKFWGGLAVGVLLLVSAFIIGKPGFFKGDIAGGDPFKTICESNSGTIDNAGNCQLLIQLVPKGNMIFLQKAVEQQLEPRCNELKAGGLHAEFIQGEAATNGACSFNTKIFYNLKELNTEEKAVNELTNSCTGSTPSGLWIADTDGKGYRCRFNDKEFTTANLIPVNLLQDERATAGVLIQMCKENYGEPGGGSNAQAADAGSKITCAFDGKTYFPNPPDLEDSLVVAVNNAINKLRTLCSGSFATANDVVSVKSRDDKECTLPVIGTTPIATYTINQTTKVESELLRLAEPLRTLCEDDVTVQRNEGQWNAKEWACVFPQKLKDEEDLVSFKDKKYYTALALQKAIEEEKKAIEILCTKDPIAVKNGATFDKKANPPVCLFLNVNYETTAAFQKALQTELDAFRKFCTEDPLLQQYKPVFENNTCKLTPLNPDIPPHPPFETKTELEQSITQEATQIAELCKKLGELGITVSEPTEKQVYCTVGEKQYQSSLDLSNLLKRETAFKKACETAKGGTYAEMKCTISDVGTFESLDEMQRGLATYKTCTQDSTKTWDQEKQQCSEKADLEKFPMKQSTSTDFQVFCTEKTKGMWDPEMKICTVEGKKFSSVEELLFSKVCTEEQGSYENGKCTIPEKETAPSREKLTELLSCEEKPGYVWDNTDETCKTKDLVEAKAKELQFRDRCGGIGGTFKNEDSKMSCTVPNQGTYTSLDDLEKGIEAYTKCKADRKEWDTQTKTCKEPLQVEAGGKTSEVDDLKKQIEDLKQQLAGAEAQGSSQTQALTQQIANLVTELRAAQTAEPPSPVPPPASPPAPPPAPPPTIVKKTKSISEKVEAEKELTVTQKTVTEPSRQTVFTPAESTTRQTSESGTIRSIAGTDAAASVAAQQAAQAAAQAAARAAQASAAAEAAAQRAAAASQTTTSAASASGDTQAGVTRAASTQTAKAMHGAFIQGKTGPEIFLYPVVIFGANGLYYLWRKRRKQK